MHRPTSHHQDEIVDWLMDGDPAIRWQVLRDLLAAPASDWTRERRRVATDGWGARLLKLQDPEGTWGQSLYGCPKWTCTTYTLLLLRDMGLPPDCKPAQRGAAIILHRGVPGPAEADLRRSLARTDTCIVGMWLGLGAYFAKGDPKLPVMANHLLDEQMPDGGWNCRRRKRGGAVHSSFHTTLNVLEGLREAIARSIGPADRLRAAETRALEFILAHRFYRSDKTGQVIDEKFTRLSYPPRWHYDVLRGLDYARTTPATITDPRTQDALDLLQSRRRPDGRWTAQNKHPGKVYFDLEPARDPSRWNTLRALRCLRAAGG